MQSLDGCQMTLVSSDKQSMAENVARGSGGVRGFRVDGDAGDLREVFLDAVFKSGGDIVNPGNGEFTLHDAVAGNEDVMLDLADANIVAIDELVVRAGHAVEESFHGHFQL